jgi:hypothetical protein
MGFWEEVWLSLRFRIICGLCGMAVVAICVWLASFDP